MMLVLLLQIGDIDFTESVRLYLKIQGTLSVKSMSHICSSNTSIIFASGKWANFPDRLDSLDCPDFPD